MRGYILRTLLHKELRRNLANRGGLALAGLLVVAAMLLSFFNRGEAQPGGVLGGVQRCYIDFEEEDALIRHLDNNVPPDWRAQRRLVIRPLSRVPVRDGMLIYNPGTGAIQIRKVVYPDLVASTVGGLGAPLGQGPLVATATLFPPYTIWFWHHGKDNTVLAPYEAWFWKELRRYFRKRVAENVVRVDPSAARALPTADLETNELWAWQEAHRHFQEEVAASLARMSPQARAVATVPDVRIERRQLSGNTADMGTSLATALVLFALFFSCVYTLPSMTCEEHERGVLLAQALSPASPTEILTAKFIFYPLLGMGLATVLAGIINFSVLGHLFYWLAVLVAAFGSMGIGMTIASLARTQREASMGALCYMMAVALILLICQQNQIPVIPHLALEYHCPRMLQAALANEPLWYSLGHLLGAFALGLLWAGAAAYLFRRRGWQ